jgi:hypothetical protein
MTLGLLAALSLLTSSLAAAAGTTSAEFLRLDAGARPAALGGAFTGMADGVDTIAYNPAGLADLGRAEASFTHNEHLPGIRHEWLAAAFPTERLGTFAVSVNALVVKSFAAYGADDRPAGGVSATDAAFGLAYAHGLGAGVSLGAGAQYIRSCLGDRTAASTAFDAGAHWRAGRALELGVSALHLGRGLRYFDDSTPLPRTVRIGAAVHPLAWLPEAVRLIDGLNLLADVSMPESGPAIVSGGAELSYSGTLFLRAGGRGGYAGPGYTAGVGLAIFRDPGSGTRPEVDFDYAFLDYGTLGQTHRAGIRVKFGRRLAHPS